MRTTRASKSFVKMRAFLRREGRRSSGHETFLPSAIHVFSLSPVSPWMKQISAISFALGTCFPNLAKRFNLQVLVMPRSGTRLQNVLSLELLALMVVHARSLSFCADVPNKALNLDNSDIVFSLYLPSSLMRMQQIISRNRLVHGTYENSRRVHPASCDLCFHNARVAESPDGLGS